jgi:hypothetical protein
MTRTTLSARRKASLARTGAYWADRTAKATTRKAKAVVAFDRLRAAVNDVTRDPAQHPVWDEATKALDEITNRIPDRRVP